MISKYEINKMLEIAIMKFNEFSSKAILIKPREVNSRAGKLNINSEFIVDIVVVSRSSNERRETLTILLRSPTVHPYSGDSIIINSTQFIVSKATELSVGLNMLWNLEIVSI